MVASTTFKDIYHLFQEMGGDVNKFQQWLEKKWKGKDKQETVLRLFSFLGLIFSLNVFHICVGNFNLFTFKTVKSKKEFFYQEVREVNVKDKGDASDLTGIHKDNENIILATTSKNLKSYTIGRLDIDKIYDEFNSHLKNKPRLMLRLCICIRDKEVFYRKVKRMNKSNRNLKEKASNPSNIILDWNDLKEGFRRFSEVYGRMPFKDMIGEEKDALTLKMHQKLGVKKTMMKKEEGKEMVLWGHVQRSGKSYIMAGCIVEDQMGKKNCNYLIITTAPNETIQQYVKVLTCAQLSDFNLVVLNGKNRNPQLKKKNIIVCSKQFLQRKCGKNSIDWLEKMKFDMRFLDESHYGGTTTLAKNVMEVYGGGSFTIYITATYFKPVFNYQIPKEDWILWDIEDIHLCQKIEQERNRIALVEKHGDCIREVLKDFDIQGLKDEYAKYPNLWVLTQTLNEEVVKKEVERMNQLDGEGHGFSIEGCQILKQNAKVRIAEFQNPTAVLDMWKEVRKLLRRKRDICQTPEGGRHLTLQENPRNMNEPEVIMTFLPQNDVDKISDATIQLLDMHRLFPEYLFMKINSKNGSDPKNKISDEWQVAKNTGKRGVIVLSGRQCSMGVSIPYCDTVILLNNNSSYDMINQMMFRSMTEEEGKKCGFVIDLNIHRVIKSVLLNYAHQVKPNLPIKDGFKYIIQERLITINGDDWLESFGKNPKEITLFCNYAYEIFITEPNKVLQRCIEVIRNKSKLFTVGSPEFKMLKLHFNIRKTKNHRKIKEFIEGTPSNLDKGLVTRKNENEEEEKGKETEEEDFDPSEILTFVVPLICLLTVDNKSSSFDEMLKVIQENKGRLEIFIEQIKLQGGKEIEAKILALFIQLYIKYLQDDLEFKRVVSMIKEQFAKNLNNQKMFAQIIDEFIIPKNHEKKTNAEVSTPSFLRQDMLNKVPAEFWTTPRTVFEPCAGKGGFLIDVIDRFMIGLKNKYPNEEERYRIIVEKCLYFADINPFNIFICKFLIDPYQRFQLNYHQGDTLKLNVEEKWGHQFDLVVGNPPYNSSGSVSTGNTIWQLFVVKSLREWISTNSYLLFVHPSGWRKPNTVKGKFTELFELLTKENQMLYLEMHGLKDGKKTFNCGTRYDWYLVLQGKGTKTNSTTVIDEEGVMTKVEMSEWEWLPNSNLGLIKSLLVSKETKERCPILYKRSNYGSDKKWTSTKQSGEFKYPVVHTTPKSGVRFIYSSRNDQGGFGVKKVIFGQTGINNPIVDIDGKYATSEHSMAISFKSIEEANSIVSALTSKTFQTILKSCSWSNFMIDWRLFLHFRRDFWKDFI